MSAFVAGDPRINRAGRPRGGQDRRTRWLEAMRDDNLPGVIGMVIDKAIKGDLFAAKLLLDRWLPVPTRSPCEVIIPVQPPSLQVNFRSPDAK